MIKQYLIKLAERDILTIFCTFAAIGIMRLIYDLCLLIKRKIFGEKYLSRFNQLIEGGPNEKRHYQWLLRKVSKIENEMGGFGVAAFYRPAFADYAFQGYEILSNTLLNIGPVSARDLEMSQAILERYIGALDDSISKNLLHLINPAAWLTRTVRLMLFDIPLWILYSFGLISEIRKNKIKTSSIVSKIVGVITVLGSLFSLISGWDSVMKFFNRIFGWLVSIEMN